MWTYMLRRSIYAVPAIFMITIIIFAAMRILPGDVLAVMFSDEDGFAMLRDADRERLLESLGLNDPLWQQYMSWMKDVFTLKLGESFWRGDTVMETITHRGPLSAEIAFLAILISWVVGLPVGILAAVRHNSLPDYVSRFFSILFLAIPNFWLGTLIVLVLLLGFHYKAPFGVIHIWEDPWANLQIVWGPALVLGLGQAAYVARMARSTLLEVLRDDYIRTARAKGLAERSVIWRHALRNAILPVITLSGVLLGFLLGGSVVVEKAFGVPGLGSTLVVAFTERDYTVIQNLVLLYGLIFVALNLLVDMSYGLFDPRIRYD